MRAEESYAVAAVARRVCIACRLDVKHGAYLQGRRANNFDPQLGAQLAVRRQNNLGLSGNAAVEQAHLFKDSQSYVTGKATRWGTQFVCEVVF